MRWVSPAIVFTTLALAPGHAPASSCVQVEPAAHLAAADVVFLGRAVKETAERDTLFEVERVYKGDAPLQVIVRFHRVKYAYLSPPGRYLVYAHLEHTDAGIELAAPVCSGSGLVDAKAEELRALGPGRAPRGAIVSGKTTLDDASAPAPPEAMIPGTAAPAAATSAPRSAAGPDDVARGAAATPNARNAGGCAACAAGHARDHDPVTPIVAATLVVAFALRGRRVP